MGRKSATAFFHHLKPFGNFHQRLSELQLHLSSCSVCIWVGLYIFFFFFSANGGPSVPLGIGRQDPDEITLKGVSFPTPLVVLRCQSRNHLDAC